MMRTKKLAGAAAFSAVIAAAGVAGAMFGAPSLSGAQEDSTTTTEGPSDGVRIKAAGRANLETAAEALGISAEELRTELAAGKSIADVAAEKGVDKQRVIDALVAEATERLDAAKAELPARMAEAVERDGLPGPGGRGHRGPGHRHHHHAVVNSVDDAATALGISRLELRDALEAGKSIAQVAEERGVALDGVKAAMLADANARIDQAVENGRLTAERAAEMKEDLAERIDELVTREGLPAKGMRSAPPAEGGAEAQATTA